MPSISEEVVLPRCDRLTGPAGGQRIQGPGPFPSPGARFPPTQGTRKGPTSPIACGVLGLGVPFLDFQGTTAFSSHIASQTDS